MKNLFAFIIAIAAAAPALSEAAVITCTASTLTGVVIRPEQRTVELQNRGEAIRVNITSVKRLHAERHPPRVITTYMLDVPYKLQTTFLYGSTTGSAKMLHLDDRIRREYPTCTVQ